MWHAFLQVEHTCVLAVCVHNQPIIIQNQPVFFFLSTKIFLKSSRCQMTVCVTSHRQAPPTTVWLTVAFQHRLDWCLIWSPPCLSCRQSPIVSTPEQGRRQEYLQSDWGVLLLDVTMNIAVVIYSRHLSCWICRGLYLLLRGMPPWST